MKLVILGAGASYDAFYWYRDPEIFKYWRSPLANEIFEQRPNFLNIIDSFPGSHQISSLIGTRGDIEAYFQERYEHSKKHNNINVEKQLINLKFFLQKMFFTISDKLNYCGNSNLVKLISIIDDYIARTGEDVLILSFNYDLLMERALCEHYYGSSKKDYDMGDYLSHKIKLIKPHGSCNWHRVFSHGTFPIYKTPNVPDFLHINNYTQERIDKNLETTFYCSPPTNSAISVEGISKYAFPQIHIPLKEKDDFTMPKEQEDFLNNFLPQVSEMLIVGWKGSELHFNNKLKEFIGKKPIKIQVVNGPDKSNPATILNNLKDFINTEDVNFYIDEPSFEAIRWKQEYMEFLLNNRQAGSLTSFLINLEQGKVKSLFD